MAFELGQIVKAPFPIAFHPHLSPLPSRERNYTVMKADKTITLFLDLKGHKLFFHFLVIPGLPYEVIVGSDFFQKWKIRLDSVAEDFIVEEKALKIILV